MRRQRNNRIGGIKKDILFIDYERFLLNVGCNLFQGHLKLVALPAKGKSQISLVMYHTKEIQLPSVLRNAVMTLLKGEVDRK